MEDTDKSQYFAKPGSITVLLFDQKSLFERPAKCSAIFMLEQSQEGEKRGFIHA